VRRCRGASGVGLTPAAAQESTHGTLCLSLRLFVNSTAHVLAIEVGSVGGLYTEDGPSACRTIAHQLNETFFTKSQQIDLY
jgi:hypothetical protein